MTKEEHDEVWFLHRVAKQIYPEFILRVIKQGDKFFVCAATLDGIPAFHPPYIANAEGEILGYDTDEDDDSEESEIIYENERLWKKCKESLKKPPWGII